MQTKQVPTNGKTKGSIKAKQNPYKGKILAIGTILTKLIPKDMAKTQGIKIKPSQKWQPTGEV